jgi:prepilin-type N-terminal cleavage/methylation domain-containing protein
MTPVHTEVNHRDRGSTLIELVITMAVMSVAMTIVAATLVLVQRATNQIEASSSAVDAARLVSAGLDRELRSADCISSPVENALSNTLIFRTTISAGGPVMLTYEVDYAARTVTRTEGVDQPRTVITVVGPENVSTPAFHQINTPLRTLVIDIPIESDNGGVFHLLTTIAGRNSWRPCT